LGLKSQLSSNNLEKYTEDFYSQSNGNAMAPVGLGAHSPIRVISSGQESYGGVVLHQNIAGKMLVVNGQTITQAVSPQSNIQKKKSVRKIHEKYKTSGIQSNNKAPLGNQSPGTSINYNELRSQGDKFLIPNANPEENGKNQAAKSDTFSDRTNAIEGKTEERKVLSGEARDLSSLMVDIDNGG
jgi:hypothetical protein